MKRIIFLIISIGMLISAMAQSPVFYGGLKLGMTLSEVKQVISNNGKTVESKVSNGKTSYFVKQPKIAGVTFQTLYLNFTGGKLMRAFFGSNEGAGGLPTAPRFAEVRQIARGYRADFNNLLVGLQGKYGQPVSSDDNACYWNFNGSTIKLVYEFREYVEFGMDMLTTTLSLEYEKPDTSDL